MVHPFLFWVWHHDDAALPAAVAAMMPSVLKSKMIESIGVFTDHFGQIAGNYEQNDEVAGQDDR